MLWAKYNSILSHMGKYMFGSNVNAPLSTGPTPSSFSYATYVILVSVQAYLWRIFGGERGNLASKH